MNKNTKKENENIYKSAKGKYCNAIDRIAPELQRVSDLCQAHNDIKIRLI